MNPIKYAWNKFGNKIKNYNYKKRWRDLNADNKTYLNGLKNWNRIKVGKGTYGNINVSDFNPKTGTSRLIIGNYCSIGGDVHFLLGGGHYLNRITTYPFLNEIFEKEESLDKGDIKIGDDVWIGNEVTIMSGVKIGQGAVIGTKALVTHDIPPYAIAVGIPAKIIKYRFDQNIISELLKIDFSKLNEAIVKQNLGLFDSEVTIDKVNSLKELLTKTNK